MIFGTDAGVGTAPYTPNQVINHAVTGVTLGFALDPGTLSFPAFSSSASTIDDFIADLKATVSGVAGGVAYGTFTDNNTYLVETLNGDLDAAHLVMVKIVGVHTLAGAAANTLQLTS